MVVIINTFERIKPNFNPVQLGKLLKNNFFGLLSGQREYKWSIQQWSELWDDLLDIERYRLTTAEPSYIYHFFGPMFFVIISSERKLILDGQQRLVTVSILLTTIRDLLDLKREMGTLSSNGAYTYGEIGECLLERRIGSEKVKLILGEKNKNAYEKIIKLIQTSPPLTKIDFLKEQGEFKRTESNKEMLNCYKFFLKCVYNHLAKITNTEISKDIELDKLRQILSSENSEKFLLNLYECINEYLYILEIDIPNYDIGFEIFEVLNQRGIKLEVAELFKNIIFGRLEKERGREYTQSIWNSFDNLLGNKLEKFLRHYWISKFEFVRRKKLFRAIKKKIENLNTEEFEEFLQEMISEAEIYSALCDPNHPLWEGREDISEIIDEINYLRFEQILPLLLAIYQKSPNKFKIVLEALRNHSVKAYTILGGNPNEFEEEYSKWAREIRNNPHEIENVINFINRNMPLDEKIKEGFIGLKVSKRKACYILSKINDALTPSPLSRVWRNRPTVEHVIPQRPSREWNEYLATRRIEHAEVVQRLGNLTILSIGENRDLGNLPYQQKRKRYLDTNLPVNTKTFQEFEEFNEETIKRREKILAELAIQHSIWS